VIGKKEDSKCASEIVDAVMSAMKNLPENLTNGLVTEEELQYFQHYNVELRMLCEPFDSAELFSSISNAITICVNKLKLTREFRCKLTIVMDYCKPISKGTVYYMCPSLIKRDL